MQCIRLVHQHRQLYRLLLRGCAARRQVRFKLKPPLDAHTYARYQQPLEALIMRERMLDEPALRVLASTVQALDALTD